MELQNKVVIITGASGGIGEAIACDLDAAGMSLVLTARSKDKLDKLGSKLKNAVVVAGEVTDPALPQTLLETAIRKFGRCDVLINNAGVMSVGAIQEVDIEKMCEMVRINVEACFRTAYTLLKHFKAQNSGYVINTSSIAGLKTGAYLAAYNGTKFAVEAFSDALRLEVAGTGIGVAAVAPGTVATGLYQGWDEAHKDAMFSGGALEPADIARCVRFILEQPSHVRVPRLLCVPAAQPI